MSTTTKSTSTTASTTPVAAPLKTLLADSYALMAQTHLAHWNVQGPSFFQLHTAFQSQYEELFAAIDEIAEHLRAIDVLAPGGLTPLAKMSKVPEFGVAPAPAKDFVAHLIDGHEQTVASARAVRESAGNCGDLETQDLAIARIQSHQKTLWMLKSFLQNL